MWIIRKQMNKRRLQVFLERLRYVFWQRYKMSMLRGTRETSIGEWTWWWRAELYSQWTIQSVRGSLGCLFTLLYFLFFTLLVSHQLSSWLLTFPPDYRSFLLLFLSTCKSFQLVIFSFPFPHPIKKFTVIFEVHGWYLPIPFTLYAIVLEGVIKLSLFQSPTRISLEIHESIIVNSSPLLLSYVAVVSRSQRASIRLWIICECHWILIFFRLCRPFSFR